MARPNWINLDPTSGTGAGSSEVTLSSYTGRNPRTGTIKGETGGGASDTSEVTQLGKPEFITIGTVSYNINASGGTVLVEGTSNSADLKIVLGSSTISGVSYSLSVNELDDDSWNGNTVISIDGDPGASAEYPFRIAVVIPENKTLTALTHNFSVVNANADVSSDEITISQAAGVKLYSKPVITAFKYATDIPAAGGFVVPTVTYSQTWGWNSSSTNGGTITTGGVLAFTGDLVDPTTGQVSADSKGTTESERTIVTTSSVTVTLNGKTSTASEATVYQAANIASYGEVAISGGTVADIPASGGQVASVSDIEATQTVSYTSGSSRDGEVDITFSQAVTAPSLTTTVKSRTIVGTITATATGEGDESVQKEYQVYQAANQVTNYGEITHSLTTPRSVPATGGSYNLATLAAAKQQLTYTSGATNYSTSVTVTSTVSTPLTGFSLSDNTVTVEANPNASSRNGFVVQVNFSGQGSKTASIDVTFNQQGANSTIELTPPTLEFTSDGGTQTITVSSNDSWTLDLVDE